MTDEGDYIHPARTEAIGRIETEQPWDLKDENLEV
jgi:hypothetical protein